MTARGDTQSVGNISLLIPASSLAKLARITDNDVEFHVGTTGKSIVFFKENFLFSARLMEGSYINTNQLLTAIRNGFTVLTDILDLKSALSSVLCVGAEERCRCPLTVRRSHSIAKGPTPPPQRLLR